MTVTTMRRCSVLLGIALGLAGCGREDAGRPATQPATQPVTERPSEPAPAPPGPTEPAADREAEALARANAAADRLGSTLRGRLVAAMQEGGPASAIQVCTREAPGMAHAIATETGVAVGRSSLRLRNPANAPPPWVAAWLDATGERPAAEAQGFARVEEGHARVLRPIAIEAPCVVCHGEAVAPEVQAVLRERYPDDRATGYRVGDLRGALWAEAEVR